MVLVLVIIFTAGWLIMIRNLIDGKADEAKVINRSET